MLQVINPTPLVPQLSVFANPAGVETAYLALKATFDVIDHRPQFSAAPIDFVVGDQYEGDPKDSGIAAANEVTLSKPSTDVLICGHAYAPHGHATESLIEIQVGSIQQRVKVWGDRVCRGRRLGPPADFERLPLTYQRCYGGVLPSKKPDQNPKYVETNPVGCGMDPSDGAPLPNFEHPDYLISRPGADSQPIGFGAIAPWWQPRQSFAGTYDDAYTKSRAPYLPVDFDARFLQASPPSRVSDQYLVGGELVRITGLTPQPVFTFELPTLSIAVASTFQGSTAPVMMNIDTLTIYPDEQKFTLIYRGELMVDKCLMDLKRFDISLVDSTMREFEHV